MRKRRLRLALGLAFALIAVLIAGMSVPLIWPDIANYKPKTKQRAAPLPAINQTLSVYSE